MSKKEPIRKTAQVKLSLPPSFNRKKKTMSMRQNYKVEKQGAIGRICYYGSNGKIGEVQEFTDTQLYLDALKEVFYYQGSMGYKFETLSEDPEVRKSVSKLIADNF